MKVNLSDLMGMLQQEAEEVKVRVGVAGPELSEKMQAARKKREKKAEQLQEVVAAFVANLKKEHEKEMESLAVEQTMIWEEVYEKLGLTEEEKGLRYTMEHPLGIVFRVDEPGEEEDRGFKSLLQ